MPHTMLSFDTTPLSPEVVTMKDEDAATYILKTLVGYLTWKTHFDEPDPLNLTAVSEMLRRLTDQQLEVLYNATDTRSETELIHILNLTIMRPRQVELSLMEFQEYRIQKILLLYIPPILILFGTFGNLFSFIVLRRKPMLKVSSYMYLAVLAIIDTLVLYNGLLRIWIVELMSFDYQEAGNWICKMTVAFGYVASDLSVWLIIAVTVERYIVVCFPFQASSMCNVSRARKVIVGLFLLMLVMNIHFLWTAEIVEEHGETMCRGGEHFRQLVEEVWPWVDTLIYSFLPFLTITILNVFIIREVAGAHSNRARLAASESETTCIPPGSTNTASGGPAVRRGNTCEGTRLTALLLTVSFTFLLLTLPNNIALIVSRFWNQKYERKADQMTFQERRMAMQGMAQFKLVMTIAELLMYTNHSINFFLYCATGNKFRQQVLDLLRCLQRRGHHQAPAENTITSYSVRKTSQSWCSEMTLAKLAARRKSSCVSSEDADKNVDNDVLLEGQSQMGVKPNGSYTARNVNPTRHPQDTTTYNGNQILNRTDCNGASACQKKSFKEYDMANKTSSKPCYNHTDKDAEYVQLQYSTDKHCGKKTQQRKSILRNWISRKIYQSNKKHKHVFHSEGGGLGSDCAIHLKDKEYFLLRPTVRWCESTMKC